MFTSPSLFAFSLSENSLLFHCFYCVIFFFFLCFPSARVISSISLFLLLFFYSIVRSLFDLSLSLSHSLHWHCLLPSVWVLSLPACLRLMPLLLSEPLAFPSLFLLLLFALFCFVFYSLCVSFACMGVCVRFAESSFIRNLYLIFFFLISLVWSSRVMPRSNVFVIPFSALSFCCCCLPSCWQQTFFLLFSFLVVLLFKQRAWFLY